MTTRRGTQRVDGARSTRLVRRDDRGDTLIEVLMTILVVAITAVSLLFAFSGSIAGSASHRNLVAQDVALRTVAQNVYAQVAQQQNPIYQPCATLYGSASPSSQFNAPSGYTASVAVSGYYYYNQWNVASPPDCTTPVPQQLLVTVAPSSGPSSQTTIVVSGMPASSTAFTITSITPSSVTPGTTGQYISIVGTGFQSGAIGSFPAGSGVTFTGTGSTSSPPSSPQPSSWTFLSSTAIDAQIDVVSGAKGIVTFTLTNPDGSTATHSLTITPGPTITAINNSPNPLTLYIGDNNDPFNLTGANFQSGSLVSITPSGVSFDSSNPPPGWTVVSSTSITTSVDVSPTASPGTYDVTVTNPDGQVSNAYPFTVAYPVPTILNVNNGDSGATCTVRFPGKSGKLAPRISPRDDTNVTCVVTGTNFYSPVTATLSPGNGNSCLPAISATTVNSSTSLTLTLSNPNGCTWGGGAGSSTYNLTVTTPGGSASYANAITVTG